MTKKYFGTDGIRGPANVAPLTPQWITTACFHAGRLLAEAGEDGPVLIGRDTRASGAWMAAAAAAGFCSAGREVRDGGVLPTPAVSCLMAGQGAALGVVLSASHNPAGDNGLKFFGRGGGKVSDEFEAGLEARLDTDPSGEQAGITGDALGRLVPWPGAEEAYVEHLATLFQGLDLTGKKVLVDAAHGAAYRTTPAVLRRLGATVTDLAADPDGENINAGVGALHPEGLLAAMKAGGYDFGILHDGDADRGFLADAAGGLLDGEDFLYAFATRSDPAPEVVVGTVMNNLGLETALKDRGVRLVRAAVGDRHVRAAMVKEGASHGGEPSGHVIVEDVGPTGDGLGACLAVLRCLGGDAAALGALRGGWTRFPQVLLGVKVGAKPPLDEVPGYPEAAAAAAARLGDRGRLLVRYSGTEPKVRVMVEAADADLAAAVADDLAAHLKAALPAAG